MLYANNVITSKNNKCLARKSFTLIEIIICAAILSIVLGSVLMILKNFSIIWNKDMALVNLQQNMRQVMDSMVRELSWSDTENITIPATCSSPCNSPVCVNQPCNSISFSVTDYQNIYCPGCPTPLVVNINYYLSGRQIIRTTSTNETTVIANNMAQLGFCQWNDAADRCCAQATEAGCNPKVIRIQLQATEANIAGQTNFPNEAYNCTSDNCILTEKVRMRNQ